MVLRIWSPKWHLLRWMKHSAPTDTRWVTAVRYHSLHGKTRAFYLDQFQGVRVWVSPHYLTLNYSLGWDALGWYCGHVIAI